MAAQQGFIVIGGILRVIIVHMHYDTWSAVGWERANALV